MKPRLLQGYRDLPSGTRILALAQALNLTAAVVSVTVSALVGRALAPEPGLGTLPYGIQFGVVLLATYPVAVMMRKYGRRTAFFLGAVLLLLSGVVGYASVEAKSFAGVALAHALLGGYIAHANYYRFAATDGLATDKKPLALSLVITGGLLAAIAGPAISLAVADIPGFAPYSLCYAALVVLAVMTFGLLGVWRPGDAGLAEPVRSPGARLSVSTPLCAAILSAAVGYYLMNLLMVQASLVMQSLCTFAAASFAIQTHVVAMFAPSLFAGNLIARHGARSLVTAGFLLLAVAGAIGAAFTTYESVSIGLILLGLGWNLTYVGGGALLTRHASDAERHRWQGINDTSVAAFAAMGAFSPAPLFHYLGWNATNAMSAVLAAVVGLCCLFLLTPKTSTLGAANVQK